MKKLISLALCLAVMLACTAAFAQAADESVTILRVTKAFDIRVKPLPDQYTMTIEQQDDMTIRALIETADPALPRMHLTIAFNDIWAGTERLNDVSEEDMQAIKDSFTEEYPELEFEFRETRAGTKLLTVQAPSGLDAYIYTIYMGHELEIQISPGAEQEKLSDADIERVVTFLSDMDIVPAAE